MPPQGRMAVLQELHKGHPGISKVKTLARMYLWWPGVNADSEKAVRQCGECQQVQSLPPPTPLYSWKCPSRPWARLHLDFAGTFQGKTILIVTDTHSKRIFPKCSCLHAMHNLTSNASTCSHVFRILPVLSHWIIMDFMIAKWPMA